MLLAEINGQVMEKVQLTSAALLLLLLSRGGRSDGGGGRIRGRLEYRRDEEGRARGSGRAKGARRYAAEVLLPRARRRLRAVISGLEISTLSRDGQGDKHW